MTKEERKQYNRRFELSFYIVYCIPSVEPPYVGVTRNWKQRESHHRLYHKRDTSDMFILDICSTKVEALYSEKLFHKQGYGGASSYHWNNNTFKGGSIYYVKTTGEWRCSVRIDGKSKVIKTSIHKQVVVDALEEHNSK